MEDTVQRSVQKTATAWRRNNLGSAIVFHQNAITNNPHNSRNMISYTWRAAFHALGSNLEGLVRHSPRKIEASKDIICLETIRGQWSRLWKEICHMMIFWPLARMYYLLLPETHSKHTVPFATKTLWRFGTQIRGQANQTSLDYIEHSLFFCLKHSKVNCGVIPTSGYSYFRLPNVYFLLEKWITVFRFPDPSVICCPFLPG